MRLAPLFLSIAISAWLYLAAVAWALAGVALRREPRFKTLGIGVVAGATAIIAEIVTGRRDLTALLLSFPLCFCASLVVCVGVYRRNFRLVPAQSAGRRQFTRRTRRAYDNSTIAPRDGP